MPGARESLNLAYVTTRILVRAVFFRPVNSRPPEPPTEREAPGGRGEARAR